MTVRGIDEAKEAAKSAAGGDGCLEMLGAFGKRQPVNWRQEPAAAWPATVQ